MSRIMTSISPLVICGPSGSGKSTLLKKLFAEFPTQFGFSVSHTTRQPRAGERDGEHYHFVTRAQFEALAAEGAFIEHAEFSANLYGSSVRAVADVQRKGQVCVLDIESQGVQLLHAQRPSLMAHYLLLQCPSLQVLEARLRSRNTETEESIAKRLATAARDLAWYETPDARRIFERTIVNDDLDRAYAEFRQYIVDTYKIQ